MISPFVLLSNTIMTCNPMELQVMMVIKGMEWSYTDGSMNYKLLFISDSFDGIHIGSFLRWKISEKDTNNGAHCEAY